MTAVPAPAKVEMKKSDFFKKAGKDKSADKKVQTKGIREQRENRLKWLTTNLKIYPQKNGETKSENPASDEAGEKEAKSD